MSFIDTSDGSIAPTPRDQNPERQTPDGFVPDPPASAGTPEGFIEDPKPSPQSHAFVAARATTPPAQQAHVDQLSQSTQLPASVVAGDPEHIQQQLDTQTLTGALLSVPNLPEYMDADAAARAPYLKADVGPMAQTQWALTGKFEGYPSPAIDTTDPNRLKLWEALGDGFREVTKERWLQMKLADGTATDQDKANLAQMHAELDGKTYNAQNWFTKKLVSFTKGMVPYLAGEAALTALPVVGAAAPFAWNAFQTYGPLYEDLKAKNPSADDDTLRRLSLEGSALVGAVSYALGGYGKPAKGYVERLLAQETGNLLVKPTVAGAVGQVVKNAGKTALHGLLGMGSMAVANRMGEELASQAAGNDSDWGGTIKNIFSDLPPILEDVALLSSFGAVSDSLNQAGRFRLMQSDQSRLQLASDAANDSVLLKTNPDEFERFAKLAQQTVYADVEHWNEYWKAKGEDPAARAAQFLGDGGKGYSEATATGGDLSIPAEKYLRHTAGTENARPLQDLVRLSQDALSPVEMRENLVKKLQTEDEAAKPEGKDSAAAVREDIQQKALAAGVEPKQAEANAWLWSSFFRKMGEARGQNAEDAYRDLVNVRVVRGEAPPEEIARAAQLSQPEQPVTLRKEGERGFVTFPTSGEAGEPREFNIHLLENADASTFAHESFHVFSEVLGDVATKEGVPDRLKSDYDTLLKWMGYDSHEERMVATERRRKLMAQEPSPDRDKALRDLTAKEEKATHAWEQYLLEGKAPSAELAGVFGRFKRWLTKIYRGAAGIQGQFEKAFGRPLELSDEVRGVFDRLLASEEEIQRAQERAGASKPMKEAFDAMTPEEREKYNALIEQSRTTAEDELRRRIVQADRAENTKWMKGERERISGEVDAELDGNATYRTLRVLQEGDPTGVIKAKLDRAAAVKKYGADLIRSLPKDIFAPKGEGVAADDVAGPMGWDNGQKMLEALATVPSRKEYIRGEAQRRLEQLYGPTLLDDPQALKEHAMDAIQNPAQVRRAMMELNALRKLLKKDANEGVNPDRAQLEKLKENVAQEKADQRAQAQQDQATEAEAQAKAQKEAQVEAQRQAQLRRELTSGWDPRQAKAMADQLVRQRTVEELTTGRLVSSYERAGDTAAQRSLEYAAKGDYLNAIVQKERQILDHELYRSAAKLRDELRTANDKVWEATQPAWRSGLAIKGLDNGRPTVDVTYRDASDSVLQAIGLAGGKPNPSAFDAFLSAANDAAQEIAFDADGIRDLIANPRIWGTLSPDEALNVRDAIKSIKHLAGQRNALELFGKRVSREVMWAQMEDRVSQRPAQPVRPRDTALETRMASARNIVGMVDAQLATPDTLIRMLDAGQDIGPFRDALEAPLLAARAEKRGIMRDVVSKVVKAWESLPAELRERRGEVIDLTKDLPIPEDLKERLGEGPVTRPYLWMLALNMGNDGNKQRLLDGYSWTEQQVTKVLNQHMSKPEWNFVQSVWDTLESLKPRLAELHERETGLPMPEVEATPVQTPFGEYRGGYFPAREDPRVKTGAVHQSPENIADIFNENYRRPSVASGHRKARSEAADYYINLSWSVVPGHLSQVAHDIAYREPVKQIASIILSPEFRDMTTKYLGEDRAKTFVPWLQSVANEQADSVPAALQSSKRMLGWFRGLAMRQQLGGNLASMAKHILDPALGVATGVTTAADTAAATAKAMTGMGWVNMRKFALENSQELQLRSDHVDRELQDSIRQIGAFKAGGVTGVVQQTSKFISDTALQVLGAFHDTMDKGVTTITWTAAYTKALRDAGKDSLESAEAHAQAAREADAAVRRLYPSSDIGQQAMAIRRKDFIGASLAFAGFANKIWNLRRQSIDDAVLRFHDGEAGFSSKLGAVAKVGGTMLGLAAIGAGTKLLGGQGQRQDEQAQDWLAKTVLADPFNDTPLLDKIAESTTQGLVEGKWERPEFRNTPVAEFLEDAWNKAHNAASGDDLEESEKIERLIETAVTLPLAGSGATQIHRTLDYARQLSTGEAQPRGPFDLASGLIYGRRHRHGANPFSLTQDALSQ